MSGMSIGELADRLDEVLEGGAFEHDVRRTALVALGLCEKMMEQLSDRQRCAIEAAKAYWFDQENDGRERALEEMSQVLDGEVLTETNRASSALNRLVWTSLNANTGFSTYAGDFLLGLAVDVGLDAVQIADVFDREVPGFSA